MQFVIEAHSRLQLTSLSDAEGVISITWADLKDEGTTVTVILAFIFIIITICDFKLVQQVVDGFIILKYIKTYFQTYTIFITIMSLKFI